MAEFKDTEIKWVVKNWVNRMCNKHKSWIDQIPKDALKIITACVGSEFGGDVNEIMKVLTQEELAIGDELYVALVHKILQVQKEEKTT